MGISTGPWASFLACDIATINDPGYNAEYRRFDVRVSGSRARQLVRRVRGDWGDIRVEDQKINDDALKVHCRLFSAYEAHHTTVRVFTEADRGSP
ncbi:DUF3577 domain-containing protein [Pseudomonas alkylphenolica]|uniref:Uncharacterized protein n=1 Tax=Pseudomonas alkylphenolica TaxID=237609 RepID=A0A077FC57_9PSED|nr:hypothetical protein PSAKL28_30050 [Pseudomonas alkylphenolica]